MIQYLAYADDVVIISRTETDLQSAVSQLYAEAKENGLIIHANKNKYMIIFLYLVSLDIIHRPSFLNKTTFQRLALSPS
jgi:hypothetical protein